MTTANADEPIAFGPLLRRHRLAAGLTQEALAEEAGLGTRSIQHLEGGTHLPRRDTVERLVRVLGLAGDERSGLARAARAAPRRRISVHGTDAARDPDRGQGRTPRTNLPAPLTPFVGRAREQAEVARLLASTRLLTVTGVGGAGKTRLAQRVAVDLVAAYPDGAWFVDLAPLADGALVLRAAAAALGVVEQPGQPLVVTLVDALRDRCLLLVLDNCEHLVDACAGLVEVVLTGCPAVRVLATSREPLGIAGELSWSLPPMEVPPPDWGSRRDVDLAALGRFEAVELFVERACAVDARFRVTAEDASAVVRICRALEGIPLALELAAARTRVFSVQRIAAWLDERVPAEGGAGDPLLGGGLLPLLTGGARTALPRHQALQALIDWSHDLLGDDERRLFRRLSVFVGGCSYEAVEGVCAGDGIAAPSIPDLLTRLVSCSLVVAEPVALERYRLLEPLRRYAADRLSEAGEAEPLRDRHAAWFLGLAERARPELTGAGQAAWLDRLERERENLRAVRRWAAARGAADVGLRLAGALWPFFLTRDGVAEGREWLASALAAPAALAPTAARAEVLDGACALSFRHNAGRDVPHLAEESLGIHRSLGDRRGVAWSLCHLAHRAENEGDHVRAEAVGSEALAQAREAGAAWVVAQVLETLGHAALSRGDHLLARRRFDESLAIFRDLGDRRAIAIGLLYLAWRSWEQGEHATARDCYHEALTIARELGSGFHTLVMHVNLGALARATGDYARSRALLDEALGLARTSGDRRIGAIALVNVGLVARAEGDLRCAESLVKESLVLFHDAGVEEDAAATVGLAGILAIQRGSFRRGVRLLGAVEPRHMQRVGARLLLRDDPEADEQSLRSARAALGERDFAAAMTEGQAMTPEQAVADALSDDC